MKCAYLYNHAIYFNQTLHKLGKQSELSNYTGKQAYKIHGTVGPPVPEKNWPPQKIFKTEKKKKPSQKKMKI